MKNTNKGDRSDLGREREDSPEKEKIREIMKRSKQFVIISGPSGSGKTMVIKHLVENYGFIEPPFLTTRELRSGEKEIGAVRLDQNEFAEREAEQRIFLPAHNYGNAYGADLEVIFNLVIADHNIVIEAPSSNLISDVARFLPESTVIGMLPVSRGELEAQLIQRGLNDDSDRRTRLDSAETEKEQIIRASESMDITQIIPIPGVPQDTISQIDRLMEVKGFKIKK